MAAPRYWTGFLSILVCSQSTGTRTWRLELWDMGSCLYCRKRYRRAPVVARSLPISQDDWDQVYSGAIRYNAHVVQQWLWRSTRMVATPVIDLDETLGGVSPTALTLDFVAEIVDEPTTMPLSGRMSALWHCARSGTTVESLLPLSVNRWCGVLERYDSVALEWWLQCHVTAGHAPVLPSGPVVADIIDGENDDNVTIWLRDVMVARGIPLWMRSGEGDDDLVPFDLQ
ncbi:hypothetical protein BC828DRAFT_440330 [Blastocladiella britannica]|nr:hypothetical protein BC828DRAFT_440330 [Blastocladiella britannica]